MEKTWKCAYTLRLSGLKTLSMTAGHLQFRNLVNTRARLHMTAHSNASCKSCTFKINGLCMNNTPSTRKQIYIYIVRGIGNSHLVLLHLWRLSLLLFVACVQGLGCVLVPHRTRWHPRHPLPQSWGELPGEETRCSSGFGLPQEMEKLHCRWRKASDSSEWEG